MERPAKIFDCWRKALEPDKFRKWAGILEALTRDELLVLGTAYRLLKQDPTMKTEAFWESLKAQLGVSGYSEEEIVSLCASVARTGLLLPLGGTLSGLNGTWYHPSSRLKELGELADLEHIRS